MLKRVRAFSLLSLIALPLLAATQSVVVPAGTEVHFKLRKTVNTATAKAGDRVPAELTSSIVVHGVTVAKAGSGATVRIREAEASGRMGGSAKLVFTLTSITLADGSRADVRTGSYTKEGKAHAKHNAGYIATAGVIGALAGQAIGGDSRSTAQGAAIGAGVGVGAAAATGKFDFEVPAGERFQLKLKSSLKATL